MKRILPTILFWLVIAGLLAVSIYAYLHWIWFPHVETLEFTNADLARWGSRIPFLHFDAPDVMQQYKAFAVQWVGLLVVWPLFFISLRHSLSDFPVWQRFLSGLVRVAILALIVLALVDIQKVEETSRVSIVYAVDVSPSVHDDMLAAAHDVVSEALRHKSSEVDIQVVTYGDVPRIVKVAEDGTVPPFVREEAGRTDIESALRFSYALFPENHVRRIVLLGDGNQTQGDVLSEAARARAQGIRVDVMHLPTQPAREIMVKSLDVHERDNLRVGKPFELILEISSTHETSVRLDVQKNGVRDGRMSKEIALTPGDNYISMVTEADAPGSLEMRFALDGVPESEDRFAENNAIIDKFTIQGKPKVLYIEENANNAAYLQRALAGYGDAQGQGFDVEVRAATGLPESARDIQKYAAVILGDVPREAASGRINVTSTAMNVLQQYVKKQSGGFIALGGENAFGPGGYANTPIEQILPVSFKNDADKNQPSAAIALLIDKSGSMADGRALDIAKEAAKGSVATLKPQDRVMVVGFDDAPYLVVPLTRAVNRYSINDKISRMRPNGGTNIRDALEMAYLEMSMVSAKTKHVILLTDGHSAYAGIDKLVREMAKSRITVSTIAMASADTTLLSRIANLGKGRAYIARDASSVPRLFLEETERVVNKAIVETPFVPTVAKSHEMVRGVSMQTLLGYVGTKAKSGSQTILTAPGGAPILAHWNYGTGKATVFTSDAKNRWASAWIKQSSSFAKFWAQVVRATMKTDEETLFAMYVEREDDHVRVMVDAISDQDTFLNGLSITSQIARPDGESMELELPQTAPGFYEAAFPLPVYGTYQANAELFQDGQSMGFARKTFSYPYALEYAQPEPDYALLDAVAQTTGGLVDPEFTATSDPGGVKLRAFIPVFYYFLWLALAGLLLDVILRRIRFARR